MSKFFFTGLVFSIVISAGLPAYATVKADMQKHLPLGQVLGNALGHNPAPMQVKDTVAEIVKDGGSAYQAVKMALNSGLDPQTVIAGAIEGQGRLSDIFRAALDAGYNENFISRVASNAGESSDTIASAMATAQANGGGAGMETAGNGPAPSDGSGIPAGGAGGGGGNVSNNQ